MDFTRSSCNQQPVTQKHTEFFEKIRCVKNLVFIKCRHSSDVLLVYVGERRDLDMLTLRDQRVHTDLPYSPDTRELPRLQSAFTPFAAAAATLLCVCVCVCWLFMWGL